MSEYQIVMPKLGESIQEGTITKWFKNEGDNIEEDDLLFEVATDKVDSEIPSPVDGNIIKILFKEGSIIPIGQVVAIIDTSYKGDTSYSEKSEENIHDNSSVNLSSQAISTLMSKKNIDEQKGNKQTLSNRFYSPLVLSIAKAEGIDITDLEKIIGSGLGGRVQKRDILNYLDRKDEPITEDQNINISGKSQPKLQKFLSSSKDEVIMMDRVRKLIADHMVMSKKISPHVTTVVEADVTNLVNWREANKDLFLTKYGEKITYTPIFIEVTAKAIKEFPLVNSSVDGDKILLKKDINIGVAVARPDGNLIVPVIKNSEQKNIIGLTKEMNRLANSARNNKLLPEEIQGGTFTITNFGTFRNLIGTPIINQPQVAILAPGSIEKKPGIVILNDGTEAIAIRHKMYISLSYDHRVIDGALGGAFLRRIADLLEQYDINRTI